MAFKHRKLFPVKNETIEDCSVFCDPSCPYKYNCFPIPDPTLIYPPPQPPPPSLNKSHKDQPISPFVIIIITLLSSLFLLISYYAIIVKHCTRSNTPPSRQDSADEEQQRLDENQGPVIDHPIWLITTVGLQQSIINSITVCKYKKGEGLIEGTDCSVCLSDFREDETLRLLPKCNHAFHTHCIDTWLRSHTNCPLCRARIVSETVNSNSASTERNSQSLSVNEETQMGNYQGDGELSDNQVRNSTGVGENRAETEDVCEQQQQVDDGDIRRSKEGVNSDNGSNGFSQVLNNGVGNHQNMEDEVQQLRRSISMDSSSTTSISVGLATFHSHGEASDNLLKLDVSKFDSDVLQEQDDNNSRVSQSIGSTSSTEETLENSSVSMKRSLSYGGGRSFWPRHNQCRNSILPL